MMDAIESRPVSASSNVSDIQSKPLGEISGNNAESVRRLVPLSNSSRVQVAAFNASL
jgi:hypothetical protein